MANRSDDVAIRFSRRELAFVWRALEGAPLPADPDDARLVLDLRTLLEGEVAKGAKP